MTKRSRKPPQKLASLSRSEVLAIDLYTNDRTGVNTATNGKKLQVIHAARLKVLGIKRDPLDDDDDLLHGEEYLAEELIVDWIHLCDSFENPAAHCVYAEDDEEQCVYCHQPFTRQ